MVHCVVQFTFHYFIWRKRWKDAMCARWQSLTPPALFQCTHTHPIGNVYNVCVVLDSISRSQSSNRYRCTAFKRRYFLLNLLERFEVIVLYIFIFFLALSLSLPLCFPPLFIQSIMVFGVQYLPESDLWSTKLFFVVSFSISTSLSRYNLYFLYVFTIYWPDQWFQSKTGEIK